MRTIFRYSFTFQRKKQKYILKLYSSILLNIHEFSTVILNIWPVNSWGPLRPILLRRFYEIPLFLLEYVEALALFTVFILPLMVKRQWWVKLPGSRKKSLDLCSINCARSHHTLHYQILTIIITFKSQLHLTMSW
jgi:hypothetical protein